MEVKSLQDSSPIFRVFTACQGDPKTLLLDVRPQKQFHKLHIALSYNIRLSANGKALLDYSKSNYDLTWSSDCWWGKPVIVYGEPGLRKDHPVVRFLAADNKCTSLSVYRPGFQQLEQNLPYLCTSSIKANCAKKYPSEIIPRVLYLGEWSQAEAVERLAELNIRRVITIHNSPENLELPPKFRHLRFQLADVDTQNVAPYFNASYDFIEEARASGHGTLVHCGAGVSRSAALVIAYLMRKNSWNAAKARSHCVERRSIVQPNDGFWRSLCALESQLGIGDRSDVNAGTTGYHGLDAAAGAAVAEDAAGAKVEVKFVTAKELASRQASGAERPKEEAGSRDAGRERSSGAAERQPDDKRRSRSRSRSPAGGRRQRDNDSRDRDRDRDRSGERERRRDDRHRDERRRRDDDSRDRDRDRRRGSSRERSGEQAAAPLPPQRSAVFEVSKDGKVVGQLHLGLEVANQRAMIGRVPSCDMHLEHLSISRQHATLTTDPAGHLFLTDLGAAHGTNVDGVWMRPNVGRQLQRGNVIRFGASTRQYKVLTLPSDEPTEQATAA